MLHCFLSELAQVNVWHIFVLESHLQFICESLHCLFLVWIEQSSEVSSVSSGLSGVAVLLSGKGGGVGAAQKKSDAIIFMLCTKFEF